MEHPVNSFDRLLIAGLLFHFFISLNNLLGNLLVKFILCGLKLNGLPVGPRPISLTACSKASIVCLFLS